MPLSRSRSQGAKASRSTSPLWTPPYRGFKCLEQNLGSGLIGADHVYLWYRKRDTLYTRESLRKRVGFHIEQKKGVVNKNWTRGVASGVTLIEAIEEKVRRHIRMGQSDAQLDIEELFQKFAGKKRYLRRRDFAKIMRKLGVRLPRSEMRALFDKQDYDKNGKLSHKEFIEFYSLCKGEVDEIVRRIRVRLQERDGGGRLKNIRRIFSQFDIDGDGSITLKEFKQALSSIGMELTRDELERIMERFDHSDMDAIDCEEFARFISLDAENRSESSHRRNIRSAARTLHAYIRRVALKGERSGKLAVRPDWGRAWRRMHGLGKVR